MTLKVWLLQGRGSHVSPDPCMRGCDARRHELGFCWCEPMFRALEYIWRVCGGFWAGALASLEVKSAACRLNLRPTQVGLTMTAEWHYVYPSTPHLRIPEAPRPADEWWVPDINNVIEAAWLKRWDIVEAALDRGYPVHARSSRRDFCTLLHVAAARGHVATLRRLLAAGADPNAPTRYKKTPVHCAGVGGKAAALAWLLAAGGDPGAAGLWSLPLVAVPAGSSHSPEPDEPLRAPCRPCAATHHTVGLIVQRPRTQAAACLELLASHARAPCNWWEQFVASQAWPDYPKSKQLNRAQLDEVSVGVYYLCVAVCLCAAYVLHDCACLSTDRLVCMRACALWGGLLGHVRVNFPTMVRSLLAFSFFLFLSRLGQAAVRPMVPCSTRVGDCRRTSRSTFRHAVISSCGDALPSNLNKPWRANV